ncbi:MAG: type VI secretion system baseplate subunit TssF [Pseudomonadota bacterium]
MDREFLSLYNDELRYLNDHAEEFANEFPGIAEHLGGLTREAQDPLIMGLLEGAAFLSARVQLKIRHEFHEFCANYLEQLLPEYLAPTPSAMLVAFQPPFGDPALRQGFPVTRGSLVDATYLEAARKVACRYQLRAPVTLWPYDIEAASHLPSEAAIDKLGITVPARTPAGLMLTLRHRTAAARRDEPQEATQPDHFVSAVDADALTVHLTGDRPDSVLLYEFLFAKATGVFVRYLDRHGDAVSVPLGIEALEPIGLDTSDFLIPEDPRVFRGFHYLREYFWFQRKLMGFRVTGLKRALAHAQTNMFDIVIGFSEPHQRFSQIIDDTMFTLYAAPAVNLFPKSMDRMTVTPGVHEYHVVPDRTHMLDFEPYQLTDVSAHLAGSDRKVRMRPLYSSPGRRTETDEGFYYTLRRVPRRRSAQEERIGRASAYAGTELFLSISEPKGAGFGSEVAQVSVRGLCTNRHLPEQLPVGATGTDFVLLDNTELSLTCVAGPTAPRSPVVSYRESGEDTLHTGAVAWRLINFMSLNQLGLAGDDPRASAAALRQLLVLFADPKDATARRAIAAVEEVAIRPIVRRIKSEHGYGAARGLEITVTVEDGAFEGTGAFLFGMVLNQFFAEYVSLNRFTQMVMKTLDRGEIKRWPPVFGTRPNL